MNELNIAKTLVLKRKDKGITQDELASFLGVSKAAVSKWENGQSYPDITFLPQLATFFNITVDELICYEPQMINEDIKKLYYRLCTDFTCKPLEEVVSEIEAITKKYFSCFPLLLQMGTLLVNHYDIVDLKIREPFINQTLEIFIRIQAECPDMELCNQAKCMEAVCYLLLNRPLQIIELLQNSNYLITNESLLLAQGQLLNGQLSEANKTLQIGAYQALISLIQNLISLFQNAELSQIEEIEQRIVTISHTFHLDALSPATMFSVYLTQAQIHLSHDNEIATLNALQKYVDLATQNTYPLTLHGDAFFTQIDSWLAELNMGIDMTRSNKIVKAGIVAAIKDNPMFLSLKEQPKFRFLLDRLSLLED